MCSVLEKNFKKNFKKNKKKPRLQLNEKKNVDTMENVTPKNSTKLPTQSNKLVFLFTQQHDFQLLAVHPKPLLSPLRVGQRMGSAQVLL